VWTGIGKAPLAAGHGAEAAAVFQQAIQIEPENALNYVHAGLASKAARRKTEAIQSLEKAIQLDPLLEQPYRELAGVYSGARDPAMTRQTYERFLKAFPKSIRAQSAVLNGDR
jgi:tetratricopeptide (TPR) repeat protein